MLEFWYSFCKIKLLSLLHVVLWVVSSVVKTFLPSPFVHFRFLIEHLGELIKKLGFWGLDFVCGYFWVWGDVAKMDMLLELRKYPPLDPKFIIFYSFITKLFFWFYRGNGSLNSCFMMCLMF